MSSGWNSSTLNINADSTISESWAATNTSIRSSGGGSATKVPQMIGEGTGLIAVATICTLLRMWSRRRVRAGYWWDDWCCVLSLICSILHFSLYMIRELSSRSVYCSDIMRLYDDSETRGGLGQHTADIIDISPRDRYISSILTLPLMFVYFLGLSLVKTSILFFILRIDARLYSLRLPAYISLAIVTASWIAICLATIFQCTPIKRMWDFTVPGTCIDRPKFYVASTWICIVTDVMIYLLPIKTLWQVRLPVKQRIGLVFVFVVGFSVIVVSCLRLDSLKNTGYQADPTWAAVSPTMWATFELNIAITVACLPSLKPLVSSFCRNRSQTQLGGSEEIPGSRDGDEPSADSRAGSTNELRPINREETKSPEIAVHFVGRPDSDTRGLSSAV